MKQTPLLILCLLCLATLLIPRTDASPLDDRIESFEAAATQNEAQVQAILQAGVQESRSAEALAVVQPWLNRNHLNNPQALLLAAQASERSGQWLAAVGYYQRLLQTPNLNANLGNTATDSVYRLLLNGLGDQNAGYLFMRRDGNRIRNFGSAKRYDRWFLDQARGRRDLEAMAERLAVMAQDNRTQPASYEGDLEWLCRQFEAFRVETPEAYAAALALSRVNRVPAAYRARLAWPATVMPYNLQLDELRNNNAPAIPSLTDAPLAAADELLRHSPDHGAMMVLQGWGSGYNGHNEAGARFRIEEERKFSQLYAHAPRMSADRRDDLYSSQIAFNRLHWDPARIAEIVIANPDTYNSIRSAPPRLYSRGNTTVEQARALAPHLARNPHPDAALIRAIARSGSLEFEPIAQAIIQSEMWRFAETRPALDLAWNGSVERTGDRNAVNERFAQMPQRFTQVRQQVAAEANSQQRMSAFNALRNDLLSNNPSIPGALSLWNELFVNAPDADQIQMIRTLVNDLSGEREQLLRLALVHANFGENNGGRLVWQAAPTNGTNHYRYHRGPVLETGGELIAHLQGMVQRQMQAGELNPSIFGMWMHGVNPADESARTLIRDLAATAAYRNLPLPYRVSAADQNHFGHIAMAPDQAATNPNHISRELLALTDESTPRQVEDALHAVVNRASNAPVPVVVLGVQRVAALEQWSDRTRNHVLSLFRENMPIGDYPTRQGYEQLLQRLARELQEGERWNDLEQYAAGLWHAAAFTDDHRHFRGANALATLTEAAHEAGAVSAALSMARSASASRAGLEMSRRSENDPTQIVGRLSQVQGRASIAIGLIDIPVDERDPSFPIYQSQAEFAIGNIDTAWRLYDEHSERVQPIVRELTVPYCLWLLERDIEARESERAETLIRELTVWSREAEGTFTPEQEGALRIAYADAAFQRGALQTARAWYRRVADAEAYEGTPLQYEAMLRTVRVDRASRDFDAAMAELDRLMQVRDPALRIATHFARAEVLFDQENYGQAFAEVTTVLNRDPGHADALILLGHVQLEMRRLVDASEIELGISEDQNVIVPGEVVKINLNDPALNVSGIAADIEVEVVTASGDRERVMLYQLGDDRTRFRADVPTALAPRVPNDGVLQVLGRDEIRYGYSQRFRERMDDLPPDPDVVINVASDANLSVSAGAFPPRQGERRLDLAELGIDTAQQTLGTRRVRPGNPIYIRVTDPDHSLTDEVDQVIVGIQTTNGDQIPRLVLTETGPHTGEFQATVPTAGAQALAYASESAPGRDANMVISANADYPGWAGEVGSQEAQQYLTIDLNDNVPLGTMNVQCNDADQAVTHFVVQTSMNGTDWVSRARFPNNPAPYTGRPQITAFPNYNRNSIAISTAEDWQVPEDWRHKMEIASAAPNINYGAFEVQDLAGLNGLDLPSGGHPGYGVLIRYRALFYQDAAAIRTFRLTGLPAEENTQTIFLLNGQPAEAGSGDAMTITRELRPGLHEIEIWRQEGRNALVERTPVLLSDSAGNAELAPCPPAMFDPATFPENVQQQLAGATSVTASEDDANTFNIAFGDRARARLVRLAIVGHQGPAPAVYKVTMVDGEGEARLPVTQDYQTLFSNDQLEVVPGDDITVRYEDDLFVTPRAGNRSGRVSVAFNTASLTASFVNIEVDSEGNRREVYEPIHRFEINDGSNQVLEDGQAPRDVIAIVINDADMDQSAEHDTVPFIVRTSDGDPVTLQARETEPHSGVFVGRVFAVAGEPQRDSEIRVTPGGTITATYHDAENLDPGIPTDRTFTVEHARFSQPSIAVYDVSSSPIPPDPEAEPGDPDERGPEIIEPRYTLAYHYLDEGALERNTPAVTIGSSLRFDIMATHLAFAGSSEIVAYVQTESGREAHGETEGPFDINVPGTIRLTATPARGAATVAPEGYLVDSPGGPPNNTPAMDEGRFAFTVPLVLDDTPERSYGTRSAQSLPSSMLPDYLAVRPDDRVYIGFAYIDSDDEVQWITSSVVLTSDALLNVMNSRYRVDIDRAYIGESLYVRLIAPDHDTTADRDSATVRLTTESGTSIDYELRESEVHSGVFKGSFDLSYAEEGEDRSNHSVALRGMPVVYGDRVTVTYPQSSSDGPDPVTITVNMGADGQIEPFSKRYTEDEMAVQTTFTLAECFFELARHHSEMGQESLARRELGHAQKLLSEALASHRDEELQAHAEYLLGNLSQEFADLTENAEMSSELYQDALARFTRITLEYPESEFAPMAQFKRALIYEKLEEIDIAIEEYVKLAYTYPEHELIPSVMSRIGSFFQDRGTAFKNQAEAIEGVEGYEDDVDAQGEALRLRALARQEYMNAAQVFQKLQERFPTDDLAGLAGLRSAQNFMRAGDYPAAIEGFQIVVDTEEYDDRTIRAQALYWQGISYERLEDLQEAYQIYRRITFDFPDAIWARRARGRLADPAFARIIEMEQLARERLLESLEEQRQEQRRNNR